MFARHNAVDTPALLPDGTPSELSVSRVLSARGQTRTAWTANCAAVATIEAETRRPAGAGDHAAGEADDTGDAGDAGDTGDDRRARYRREGEPGVTVTWWLYLSVVLFAIGAATVLVRRNAIIVFMGVELMLNATNLAFVTFARMHGDLDGQVIALFVMLVAAAEVVVGLAIIMTIFRTRRSASVDDANLLKY